MGGKDALDEGICKIGQSICNVCEARQNRINQNLWQI